MTKKREYNHEEEVLQSKCIVWANNTYPELRRFGIVHLPNGDLRTLPFQRISKAIGIKSGFPDLQVILPDGKIFFIEMKTEKGRQSENQIKCQKWLESRGLEYYVINREDDFKELINRKMSEFKENTPKHCNTR